MQRSYISLIGGVVMAVIAVVLMTAYVRSVISDAPAPVPLTAVVVAATDLPFGTPLTSDEVKIVPWPQASLPDGAFKSKDELFQGAKKPEDRIVIATMVKGEPVLRSRVSGFGTRPTMSARVPPGMRAVSIHIDDVSGVSGFILPGDHVDIMLTHRIGRGAQNLVTEVIMQSVTVLGIDQLSDQKSDKPVVGHTATVEVSPVQAEKLILAQQAGILSLALRNQSTLGHETIAQVTESDLNVKGPPKRVYEAPTVRVRYGNGDVVNRAIGQ